MKTTGGDSFPTISLRRRAQSAFTLVEVMVALALFLLIVFAAMDFLCASGRTLSGTTTQCVMNGQAGYAIELIQSRVRLATYVSTTNDLTGNTLTLGFDDDPTVDSNGDGIPWNDRDHYEVFQVQSIGITNASTNTVLYNRLIYTPDRSVTNNSKVLISGALRALPNWKVFTVTNNDTVLIRLGIYDTYANDYWQSFDIQAAAVSLNRPATGGSIPVLTPY